VPVRGEIFGPECLGEVLGKDTLPPRPVPARPRDPVLDVAGAGFLGALAASILPWTRYGGASGWFGAWGILRPRWSSIAAVAALAGVVTWVLVRRGWAPRLGRVLVVALATASISGAVLHCFYPPPFTHPWLGPWVAIPAGSVTLVAAAWTLVQGPIRDGSAIP
jgi:hypothetical protein